MKDKKIRKTILYYIGQYKKLFSILFLCVVATTFSGSLYPYIFGLLIDKVFTQKDFSMLARIVLLYVAIFVINQCLHFILNLSWAKLMVKYIYRIREDMFRVLQRLPSKDLADKHSGDIIQRINWDSEQFLLFVHKNVFYLIAAILEFGIALGMIFFFNWITGILILLVTPIVVYTSRYFSKQMGRYYDRKTRLNGERNAWIFEVLEHIHELKLLQAQKTISKSYSEQNEEIFDNKLDIAKKENKIDQINKGILLASQLAIYAIAILLIWKNQITIGSIISILGYYEICISSFNSINKKVVALRDNQSSILRCIEVLEKSSEEYNSNGLQHDIIDSTICFENVSFSYNENNSILKNVDLKINGNETLGIVGLSGCGKSTLASLINKLYVPNEGKITIDDIDINDYQLQYLREQIGVVYQDNSFFKGSVRFNLIFSEDKSQDEELLRIIDKVGLRSVINELPNGLDTIIMDGNIDLSGGQRQRLSIVRAYVKKPKIIIFDEATSALDSKSEEIVLKTWTDLFKNSTKVVIAHRLSTIINADRIAMLNNGGVEMVGTHEELMKNCVSYKKLFSEQAQLESYV